MPPVQARTIRWSAACVCAAGVLAAVPGAGVSSRHAFPGKNGLIAFESFRDGFAQVYVMTDAPTQPKRVGKRRRACYALPVWSPGAKQIAFEFNPNVAGSPARNSDVYVMNRDGTGRRNLTRKPGFDGDPSWSPNAREIVFESQRDGNSEIYKIDVRTLRATRLTRSAGFDGDPAWSPDGRRIAFTSTRDGNLEIFLMNSNGSSPVNITRNPARDSDPSWSPNGAFVAFISDRDRNLEIYTTNDRFLLRRLTNNPALDAFPAWSPDGKSIAFVSDRAEPGNRDLYAMKSDGTSVRRLTESPAWDEAPDWSTSQRFAVGTVPGAPPAPPTPRRDSAIACVER